MLAWSQLLPIGAGPDEPSNFIKSAAIIRGEFIGEDKHEWILSVDGWAFDSGSGIHRVIVTADGQVVGDGVPSIARQDVADVLSIDADSLVGFSIKVKFSDDAPRSYVVYSELNDGNLVILEVSKNKNIVSSGSSENAVEGRLPIVSRTSHGFVDQSRFYANLDLSYWSTSVDIDPQFGVALSVPWCFAPVAERPACNMPIEDQIIIDNPPWTGMGHYPPGGFAFSGIGTLVGPNDFAFRLSRAINSGISAILLALAFACLKRRSLSALPLIVALTPGVLFISAVINPSGTEICAAMALWAALPSFISAFKVLRVEALTVALSGVLLIVARPLGTLLYAVVVATVVIASGSIKKLWSHLRNHKIVYGLHSISALFMIWWYLFVFNSVVYSKMTAGLPKISLAARFLHAIGDIPRVIDESIGNYGWLDTPTPRPIAIVILLTTVVIIAVGWAGLVLSTKRAVMFLGISSILLIIAEDFNYYNILRGFGVQGRHITPLLVGIPIIGARYLRLTRHGRRFVVVIWCLAVIGSGLAALRRYSVGVIGDNAHHLFTQPVWEPPLGIAWSIILLIIATTCVGIVLIKSENGVT